MSTVDETPRSDVVASIETRVHWDQVQGRINRRSEQTRYSTYCATEPVSESTTSQRIISLGEPKCKTWRTSVIASLRAASLLERSCSAVRGVKEAPTNLLSFNKDISTTLVVWSCTGSTGHFCTNISFLVAALLHYTISAKARGFFSLLSGHKYLHHVQRDAERKFLKIFWCPQRLILGRRGEI